MSYFLKKELHIRINLSEIILPVSVRINDDFLIFLKNIDRLFSAWTTILGKKMLYSFYGIFFLIGMYLLER